MVLLVLAVPCPPVASSSSDPSLDEIVQAAFQAVHEGWSVDEVLVDDELNAAFIHRCRQQVPDAAEADLNWELLNLRKSGRLKPPATRTRRMSHDSYLHAAEIAARYLYDKYRLSVDRVLCDPKLRAEFDRAAQQAAPDVTAYRLRKAALALRKMIHSRKPRFNVAP